MKKNQRNKEIVRLRRDRGMKFGQIATRFGLTEKHTRRIYREKLGLAAKKNKLSPFASLSDSDMYDIKKAMGNDSPTLIDFQRWMEGNEDWKEQIIENRPPKRRYDDVRIFERIEAFARDNGIRMEKKRKGKVINN